MALLFLASLPPCVVVSVGTQTWEMTKINSKCCGK